MSAGRAEPTTVVHSAHFIFPPQNTFIVLCRQSGFSRRTSAEFCVSCDKRASVMPRLGHRGPRLILRFPSQHLPSVFLCVFFLNWTLWNFFLRYKADDLIPQFQHRVARFVFFFSHARRFLNEVKTKELHRKDNIWHQCHESLPSCKLSLTDVCENRQRRHIMISPMINDYWLSGAIFYSGVCRKTTISFIAGAGDRCVLI